MLVDAISRSISIIKSFAAILTLQCNLQQRGFSYAGAEQVQKKQENSLNSEFQHFLLLTVIKTFRERNCANIIVKRGSKLILQM